MFRRSYLNYIEGEAKDDKEYQSWLRTGSKENKNWSRQKGKATQQLLNSDHYKSVSNWLMVQEKSGMIIYKIDFSNLDNGELNMNQIIQVRNLLNKYPDTELLMNRYDDTLIILNDLRKNKQPSRKLQAMREGLINKHLHKYLSKTKQLKLEEFVDKQQNDTGNNKNFSVFMHNLKERIEGENKPIMNNIAHGNEITETRSERITMSSRSNMARSDEFDKYRNADGTYIYNFTQKAYDAINNHDGTMSKINQRNARKIEEIMSSLNPELTYCLVACTGLYEISYDSIPRHDKLIVLTDNDIIKGDINIKLELKSSRESAIWRLYCALVPTAANIFWCNAHGDYFSQQILSEQSHLPDVYCSTHKGVKTGGMGCGYIKADMNRRRDLSFYNQVLETIGYHYCADEIAADYYIPTVSWVESLTCSSELLSHSFFSGKLMNETWIIIHQIGGGVYSLVVPRFTSWSILHEDYSWTKTPYGLDKETTFSIFNHNTMKDSLISVENLVNESKIVTGSGPLGETNMYRPEEQFTNIRSHQYFTKHNWNPNYSEIFKTLIESINNANVMLGYSTIKGRYNLLLTHLLCLREGLSNILTENDYIKGIIFTTEPDSPVKNYFDKVLVIFKTGNLSVSRSGNIITVCTWLPWGNRDLACIRALAGTMDRPITIANGRDWVYPEGYMVLAEQYYSGEYVCYNYLHAGLCLNHIIIKPQSITMEDLSMNMAGLGWLYGTDENLIVNGLDKTISKKLIVCLPMLLQMNGGGDIPIEWEEIYLEITPIMWNEEKKKLQLTDQSNLVQIAVRGDLLVDVYSRIKNILMN